MKNSKYEIMNGYKVRTSHFPVRMFAITFVTFLLLSGIHEGIIVGSNKLALEGWIQTGLALIYWFLVAVGFTMLTRWQIKKAYEEPLRRMADATARVANGDFSVYVSTINTLEKLDYLDIMIMDFNKMVEELGSIETLKTDFFSNVSHEIKTPIAVIQNTAELLKGGNLTEEQLSQVDSIYVSSKKLAELITNILKLNKLEKQNIQPELQKYDLCRQLCDCALQFENVWEAKNIDFEADIEDEAFVTADMSLLDLAWTNLISNAMKFTEDKGRIILREETKENGIVVSIEDNGCGMTEETQKHIFEKFYQGDTSHATRGNGLGLALTFRIIQMMDGRIDVESEYGKGSIFRVFLPISKEKKEYTNGTVE